MCLLLSKFSSPGKNVHTKGCFILSSSNDPEVIGSNPAWTYYLHSDVYLNRSLMEAQQYRFSLKMVVDCAVSGVKCSFNTFKATKQMNSCNSIESNIFLQRKCLLEENSRQILLRESHFFLLLAFTEKEKERKRESVCV